MPGPNLHDDHKVLTTVYYIMGAVALGMMSLLIGLWLGVTPEEVCLPVGIMAVAVTLVGGIHAARSLGNRAETGPLAEWNGSIRTMGAINMLVAMLLIAYPLFP